MAAVSGTVKDANGNFARRLVRVHRRDTGALVGETLSNPSTGAFSVTTADTSKHYAVAHDSDAWITYLPFNGDNGSTSFPEWGGKAVTAYGNAQISTAQSKFGGASAYFDGSGDRLAVAASAHHDVGASEFTLEGWVRFTSLTGLQVIAETRGAVADYACAYMFCKTTAHKLNFRADTSAAGTSGGSWELDLLGATALSADQWYHFAVVRSGNLFSLYINGVLDASATAAITIGTSASVPLIIGSGVNGAGTFGYNFAGYLDDLRISKGVARYIANFTPPTAPHFAQQDGDPWLGNVVLGCHFNSGETPTLKDVATGKTITAVGNAAISTAQSKFGGASAYFDGAGDYLTIPASADFSFGSGDFTVEAWVYIAANSSQDGSGSRPASIFSVNDTASTFNFIFGFGGNSTTTGTSIEIYSTANGARSATVSVSQQAWHHVAVSRQGTNLRFFLDGTQVGTTITDSSSWGSASNPGWIGGRNFGSNYYGYLNGYIDDLRVTKGVARYTANFTSPAAAFPDQLLTFGQQNAMIYDHLTPA